MEAGPGPYPDGGWGGLRLGLEGVAEARGTGSACGTVFFPCSLTVEHFVPTKESDSPPTAPLPRSVTLRNVKVPTAPGPAGGLARYPSASESSAIIRPRGPIGRTRGGGGCSSLRSFALVQSPPPGFGRVIERGWRLDDGSHDIASIYSNVGDVQAPVPPKSSPTSCHDPYVPPGGSHAGGRPMGRKPRTSWRVVSRWSSSRGRGAVACGAAPPRHMVTKS